jgi:predicted lipoprotein with Yx(FWY)xxD motif
MFRSLIPASVLLVAVVAACSGAGSTPAPTVAPATAAPTATAATPAPTLAFTVSLAPAGFFVGPNGLTLYTFDKDTLGTSNCQASQCASNWPALTVATGTQLAIGAGLNASDFATITRQDGTTQVTFKEIPLYNFAGDSAVGDKNGDGVGGIWHLATKASTLPTPSAEPSAAASPAASSGTGGKVCYDPYHYVVPCPSGSAAAGSPAASAGATVSVSTAGYLVGPTGLALYEYDKDTTPGSSACTADCATNWPALTVATGESVVAGSGVDQADFATFTRTDDSTTQVTYYAKPLYYFAGDQAAGDTNGASVSPSWHLAKPQ